MLFCYKLQDVLIVTCLLSITLFFSMLSVGLCRLYTQVDIQEIVKVIKQRDAQIEAVLTSAKEISESTNKLATDTYWDNYANIQRVGAVLGNVNKTVEQVREEVIPSTNQALAETSLLLSSTRTDLEISSDRVAKSLIKLPSLIEKAEALVGTAELQLQGNGEQANITLQSLQRTFANVDKVISDPVVFSTMKSVDKTALHVAEVAQTTDEATRPLRKKAGLWRKVALVGLGMFRINLNSF